MGEGRCATCLLALLCNSLLHPVQNALRAYTKASAKFSLRSEVLKSHFHPSGWLDHSFVTNLVAISQLTSRRFHADIRRLLPKVIHTSRAPVD